MRSSHFVLVSCLVILASVVFASTITDGFTTTLTAFGPETFEHEGHIFSSQAGLYKAGLYPDCDPEDEAFIYYGVDPEFQYGFETKKVRVYGCNFSMGESFTLEGIYLHEQLCKLDDKQDETKNYLTCTTTANTEIHGIGNILFRFVAPGFGINFIVKEQYSYHNPILHYVTPYALPKADGITVRLAMEDFYEDVEGYEYSFSINGIYATTVQQAQGYILATIDLLKNAEKDNGSGTVRVHLFDGRETEIVIAEYPFAVSTYPVDPQVDVIVTSVEPAFLVLNTKPATITVHGQNLVDVSEMHIFNDKTQETTIYYRKTSTMSEEDMMEIEHEDALLSGIPLDLSLDAAIQQAAGDLLENTFDLIEGEDGIVFEIPNVTDLPDGPITVEFYASTTTIMLHADGTEVIVEDAPQYKGMTEITLIALPQYVETRPANAIYRGENVVVEYYIQYFPHHVPTAIALGKMETISAGEFLHHREGYFYFNLPDCNEKNGCHDNFKVNVCLQSLNTPDCFADLGELTYLPKRNDNTAPMVVLATNQTKYFDEFRRYHIIYGYNFVNQDGKRTYDKLRFVSDNVNRDIIRHEDIEIVPRTQNSLYVKVRHTCRVLGKCEPGTYKLNLLDEADKTINTFGENSRIAIEMGYGPGEAIRAKLLLNLDYNQFSKNEEDQRQVAASIELALSFVLHDHITQGLSQRFLVSKEYMKGHDVTIPLELYSFYNDIEHEESLLDTAVGNLMGDDDKTVTFPATVASVLIAPAMYYPDEEHVPSNAESTVLLKHLIAQIKDPESELFQELPYLNTEPTFHAYEAKLTYCHKLQDYATEDDCKASKIDYKIIIFIMIAAVLLAIVVAIVLYLICKSNKDGVENANIQDVYTQIDN